MERRRDGAAADAARLPTRLRRQRGPRSPGNTLLLLLLISIACLAPVCVAWSGPTQSEPVQKYTFASTPVVEILFPPHDFLLMNKELEIEIAMRMELLAGGAEDQRVCVGVNTVFTPPDVQLGAGMGELPQTCFEKHGNYTTFHISGLVPGLMYAITVGLMNRGMIVGYSMRSFEVASLVAKGPDTFVRMGVAEAMQMALEFYQNSEPGNAMEVYRRVLDLFPNHAQATHLLGLIYYQDGNLEEALPLIRRATQLNSGDANFYNSLGMCLKTMGRAKESVQHFHTALELNPAFTAAAFNLGHAWQLLGKWEEALHEFRKVVGTINQQHDDPSDRRSHENDVKEALARMCELVRLADGWYDAERCLSEAIARFPSDFVFHNDRGHLLLQAGQFDSSLREYETAAQLGSIPGLINSADVLEALGEYEMSIERFQQALQDRRVTSSTSLSRVVVMKATVLPRILPGSADKIEQIRAHFEENIDMIIDSIEKNSFVPTQIDPSRISFSTAITLNAHNRNNRQLKKKLALMYTNLFVTNQLVHQGYIASYGIVPEPYRQKRVFETEYPKGRLRVGFVSRFIFNPAVGLFMSELLPKFDATKYEVIVFSIGQSKSLRQIEQVEQLTDTIVAVPRDLSIAQAEIRAAKLDLLIFPELGMDKTTYFLSLERNAPIQAVWWGNPDTTGVPTIDYYLTSEHEHESFREHYSEPVYQMKGMGIYHELPPLRESNTSRDEIRRVMQERFSLPSDFRFYLSVESILHFHPDFDDAIAQILDRDPLAYVFLLGASNRKRWKQQLTNRLEARIGEANSPRLSFFNDVDAKQEIALLGAADAVLGSIHLTRPKASMQAFTAGVPVVTLVGELWGSRITYGFYQQMGVNGLVAETIDEYVSLAVRLANDEAFHSRMRRKIRRRRKKLSADEQAVREWEKFFDFAAGELSRKHSSDLSADTSHIIDRDSDTDIDETPTNTCKPKELFL